MTDCSLPSRDILAATTELMAWMASSNQVGPSLLGDRPTFQSTLRISIIGELLERFRGYDATGKQDKVYALLGMASDGAGNRLAPDYTKPWSTLLKDFGAHVL